MAHTTKARHNWWPLWLVLASYVIALFVYGLFFSGGLSGKQEHWGQFGDFVGGFLNPLVGIVTVLLIIRGLNFQAEEFKRSTEQLEATARATHGQLNEMRDADLRAALLDRAQTVYEELRQELDRKREIPYREVGRGAQRTVTHTNGSIVEMLGREHTPGFVEDAKVQHSSRLVQQEWQRLVDPARRKVRELCHYLDRIDQLSGDDKGVTDYFRRRVFEPVSWLAMKGYIHQKLLVRAVPAEPLNADHLTPEELAEMKDPAASPP